MRWLDNRQVFSSSGELYWGHDYSNSRSPTSHSWQIFSRGSCAYPVAHVLVGVGEVGNDGGVLGQLPFGHPDAVLEAHQLSLQLCHQGPPLLLLHLSCLQPDAHMPALCNCPGTNELRQLP